MKWMNTPARWAACVALAMASASLVHAKSHDADGKSKKSAKPLVYLNDSSIDFVALLPPPPRPDSLEQKAELAEIHRLQDARTDAIRARCRQEESLDPMEAFASVMGSDFTAEKLPAVAKLLKTAGADSKHFSSAAKDHWTRQRPPYVDPTLKPGATLEDEPSYPSGHATRGMVFALILSRMAPEKADALIARGEEIGFDRVYAAVHYPSDVVAGRFLGQAVANALMASPKFQADFAKAQAELRSTLAMAGK
ncbi:MAG: acid phosphatase [Tepidisphaeraceae bacterium]